MSCDQLTWHHLTAVQMGYFPLTINSASKIISYAQGFMLMQEAAKEYKWKLNKPSIALMWRGGCIIRSVFLKDITQAYRDEPELENLLFNDFFNKAIHKAQPGWREVISRAAQIGIPTPAFSTYIKPSP